MLTSILTLKYNNEHYVQKYQLNFDVISVPVTEPIALFQNLLLSNIEFGPDFGGVVFYLQGF